MQRQSGGGRNCRGRGPGNGAARPRFPSMPYHNAGPSHVASPSPSTNFIPPEAMLIHQFRNPNVSTSVPSVQVSASPRSQARQRQTQAPLFRAGDAVGGGGGGGNSMRRMDWEEGHNREVMHEGYSQSMGLSGDVGGGGGFSNGERQGAKGWQDGNRVDDGFFNGRNDSVMDNRQNGYEHEMRSSRYQDDAMAGQHRGEPSSTEQGGFYTEQDYMSLEGPAPPSSVHQAHASRHFPQPQDRVQPILVKTELDDFIPPSRSNAISSQPAPRPVQPGSAMVKPWGSSVPNPPREQPYSRAPQLPPQLPSQLPSQRQDPPAPPQQSASFRGNNVAPTMNAPVNVNPVPPMYPRGSRDPRNYQSAFADTGKVSTSMPSSHQQPYQQYAPSQPQRQQGGIGGGVGRDQFSSSSGAGALGGVDAGDWRSAASVASSSVAPTGGGHVIAGGGGRYGQNVPSEPHPLWQQMRIQENRPPEVRTHFQSERRASVAGSGSVSGFGAQNNAYDRGGQVVVKGVALCPVSEMPDRVRGLFPFSHFNPVQSKSFDIAFRSSQNLVVSAPTGSGKTCIMEVAIARLIMQSGTENIKVVYIAPTKALCNERCEDWKKKLRALGFTCCELTGDTEHQNLRETQQSNVIVTTPEKWDSVTRKWRDYKQLLSHVRLLLIDEVHMLNEPKRGATLEVVVSRMRTVEMELRGFNSKGKEEERIRMVAISATVPNIDDIAKWLSDSSKQPAISMVFGEEFRPVKLEREVIAVGSKQDSSAFQFDHGLDYKLMDVLKAKSGGKPSLVFCSTRKSANSAANQLLVDCQKSQRHPFVRSPSHKEQLKSLASRITDRKLAELIAEGIAIHHAGLCLDDRHLVENNFIGNVISVICATSTLSVGVNLPAHLVIIKGTQGYADGQFAEYSELDIMQMMGRAGRPQFDDSGVVVIMTVQEKKLKYENLVSGKEIVESSLHQNLIEHLNAEIVLGSISNIELCIEWLKSSFLYVRIQKNPARYKLDNVSAASSAENRLQSICVKDISQLAQARMLDQHDEGMTVVPTDFGKTMAKYYMRFETAKSFVQLKMKATLRDLLETMCKAVEFQDIKFRSDKTILNALNKEVKLPVNGKVKDAADKVNILIQCALDSIPFTDAKTQVTMMNDTNLIFHQVLRISRGLVDIVVAKNDFESAKNAIELSNSLYARAWEKGTQHLKQIDSIGPAFAKMLAIAGIETFDKLGRTPPEQIEGILNRSKMFGNKILANLNSLPQLVLDVSQYTEHGRVTDVEFFVRLGVRNRDTVKVTGKRGNITCAFLAGTSDNEIIDFRRVNVRNIKETESFRIYVKQRQHNVEVTFLLVLEEYVGLSVIKRHVINGNPYAPKRVIEPPANLIPWKQSVEPKLSEVVPPLSSQMHNSLPAASRATQFDRSSPDEFSMFGDDLDWEAASKVVAEIESRAFQSDNITAGTFPSNQNVETESQKASTIAPNHIPESSTRGSARPLLQHNEISMAVQTTLASDRVPCGHFCKRKDLCEHMCCKKGVLKKNAKKRKSTTAAPAQASQSVTERTNPPQRQTLENGFLQDDSSSGEEPPLITRRRSSPSSNVPRPRSNANNRELQNTFNVKNDSDSEDIPLIRKRRKMGSQSHSSGNNENQYSSSIVLVEQKQVLPESKTVKKRRAILPLSTKEFDSEFSDVEIDSDIKLLLKGGGRKKAQGQENLENFDGEVIEISENELNESQSRKKDILKEDKTSDSVEIIINNQTSTIQEAAVTSNIYSYDDEPFDVMDLDHCDPTSPTPFSPSRQPEQLHQSPVKSVPCEPISPLFSSSPQPEELHQSPVESVLPPSTVSETDDIRQASLPLPQTNVVTNSQPAVGKEAPQSQSPVLIREQTDASSKITEPSKQQSRPSASVEQINASPTLPGTAEYRDMDIEPLTEQQLNKSPSGSPIKILKKSSRDSETNPFKIDQLRTKVSEKQVDFTTVKSLNELHNNTQSDGVKPWLKTDAKPYSLLKGMKLTNNPTHGSVSVSGRLSMTSTSKSRDPNLVALNRLHDRTTETSPPQAATLLPTSIPAPQHSDKISATKSRSLTPILSFSGFQYPKSARSTGLASIVTPASSTLKPSTGGTRLADASFAHKTPHDFTPMSSMRNASTTFQPWRQQQQQQQDQQEQQQEQQQHSNAGSINEASSRTSALISASKESVSSQEASSTSIHPSIKSSLLSNNPIGRPAPKNVHFDSSISFNDIDSDNTSSTAALHMKKSETREQVSIRETDVGVEFGLDGDIVLPTFAEVSAEMDRRNGMEREQEIDIVEGSMTDRLDVRDDSNFSVLLGELDGATMIDYDGGNTFDGGSSAFVADGAGGDIM
ncbi:Sec63 [Blyttiomyces sp. JEL0837]|nr:Sec63 [Blyttiomyces sp. JEL0837]